MKYSALTARGFASLLMLLCGYSSFGENLPATIKTAYVMEAGEKYSIQYGKVEVRAKFTEGRGSWPEIWMMPEPAFTNYTQHGYNIYNMEWSSSEIKFYVNNILQYKYTRQAGADWEHRPLDVSFYLISNQVGGLAWPGAITAADLPFSMQVDYVRVYSGPEERVFT